MMLSNTFSPDMHLSGTLYNLKTSGSPATILQIFKCKQCVNHKPKLGQCVIVKPFSLMPVLSLHISLSMSVSSLSYHSLVGLQISE